MQFSDLERERSLFASCLDLSSVERAEFLKRECRGDTALRDRIERLLDAHARATTSGSLLRIPIDDIPDLIGRYQLIRVIGEGGMGTVYEAEQQEPVRRSVALKIVKLNTSAGTAATGILSRFALERQALAVMDHPNVAKVFDAGETLLGYPYFAMELVRGAPITEYCDERALPVRDRLRLFTQLCHAVQHAHQKGVIHRDLKPSNVLVTDDSGSPLAKVIDFGIAKAVGDEAVSGTATSQPIGTPAYMSPEQAGTGSGDVDTRSDIYSLGVILYELLTGALPADPAESGYANFLVRLALGELKIVPPSEKAARAIPTDLDWIVMRALDTNRSGRYASAGAFADDVERFLNDEPVFARRPTVSYRVAKFIRRHRFQAIAAGIAAAALFSGGIASAVGYVRATRAEARAREEAATAREVSDFLVKSFNVSDPSEARGRTVTAREVLDNAANAIDTELAAQPQVRRRLLNTLSRAHNSLGLYREAEKLGQKSLGSGPIDPGSEDLETADGFFAVSAAKFRLGDFKASQELLERVIAIRTRILGPNHPEVAEALSSMGLIWVELERFDKSIELNRRALAIYQTAYGDNHEKVAKALRALARSYVMMHGKDDVRRACEFYTRSLSILETTVGTDHPVYADNLDDIGLCTDNNAEALGWMERAFATRKRTLGPDHVLLAFSHHNLGRCLTGMGRLKEAKAHLEQGLHIRESKLAPDHPQTGYILESLAIAEAKLGNLSAAHKHFERCLAINMAAHGPDHSETLESHSNIGIILTMLKRHKKALPHLREGVRGRFFVDWKSPAYNPVRNDPGYLALVTEQERIKASVPSASVE